MTSINDIVLIYYEDQPFSFARIEDIAADVKKDWFHVKLLLLQLPLETITWILKDVYINGDEFTMGGKRMRFEKVVAPKDVTKAETKDEKDGPSEQKTGSATVVSLSDRKPKT